MTVAVAFRARGLTKYARSRDDWAMAESSRARGHFRGKPRPGRRVEVRYRVIEGGEPTGNELLAFTKNIGVGGAFILTPEPATPGAMLQIVIAVPVAQRPIDVTAEVRWIVDAKHNAPERDRGMGVKFSGLDVDQLLALNDYFASLTATVDIDEA
ncbi:MAG TPA: PilZ domain-containing protein [Kofleriaceae bacterium]|nr:PilZ domain-containing protein [Kofleriaceae bacterium]